MSAVTNLTSRGVTARELARQSVRAWSVRCSVFMLGMLYCMGHCCGAIGQANCAAGAIDSGTRSCARRSMKRSRAWGVATLEGAGHSQAVDLNVGASPVAGVFGRLETSRGQRVSSISASVRLRCDFLLAPCGRRRIAMPLVGDLAIGFCFTDRERDRDRVACGHVRARCGGFRRFVAACVVVSACICSHTGRDRARR